MERADLIKRRDELQGLCNRAHDQEHEYAGAVAVLDEVIALLDAEVAAKSESETKGN